MKNRLMNLLQKESKARAIKEALYQTNLVYNCDVAGSLLYLLQVSGGWSKISDTMRLGLILG